MSNRRKPKMPTASMLAEWHDRPGDGTWPQPREHEAYVGQAGVALQDGVDALPYVRQQTHDNLCNGLGDRRRSGVWWTHHTLTAADGLTDAVTALDAVLPADDPEARVVEYRTEILAVLDKHPSAVLVIAWCIAAAAKDEVVYG